MTETHTLPVLPLRDSVLFPGLAMPIGAGRPSTLKAIEAALAQPGKRIFVLAQRQNVDQVSTEGLFAIGTIATMSQMQRGLAGMQMVLHGERRAHRHARCASTTATCRRCWSRPRRWPRSTPTTRPSWR